MDNKDDKKQLPNDLNKKAINILQSKGEKEFIKHVFTDQKIGKILSYSDMRALYG